MIYLSGTYSQVLPQYRAHFGYMLNVNRQIGGEAEAVQYPWMLDNGAFNGKWREDVWRRRLEQLAPHAATCIGAVVPDVVADHAATLARWHDYAPVVKRLGYQAAFGLCGTANAVADAAADGGVERRGHRLFPAAPGGRHPVLAHGWTDFCIAAGTVRGRLSPAASHTAMD